ncbi:hypothetical protein ACUXZJ_09860 [Flavobacterium sp. TN-1]
MEKIDLELPKKENFYIEKSKYCEDIFGWDFPKGLNLIKFENKEFGWEKCYKLII